MPHTHPAPGQYDHTVTAMIVRFDGEPRVLLPLHRKYGVRFPPGGHIELDEHPWQAIAREVREETGYHFDQLDVLQYAQAPVRTVNLLHPTPLLFQSYGASGMVSHFHTDVLFGFVASEDPRDSIAQDESELEWFTKADILAAPAGVISDDISELALYMMARPEAYSRYPTSQFMLSVPPLFR